MNVLVYIGTDMCILFLDREKVRIIKKKKNCIYLRYTHTCGDIVRSYRREFMRKEEFACVRLQEKEY